jgi:Cu+-exporting ATPase
VTATHFEPELRPVTGEGKPALRTASFGIGGMHCAACASRNERALKKLPGVRDATVNFGMRNARVEFHERAVSERDLHDAVINNGFQVLRTEFAQENKDRAKREFAHARQRAFVASALTAPIAFLAMLEIELPWELRGYNLATWLVALLSTIVILGLGWEFNIGMLRQIRQVLQIWTRSYRSAPWLPLATASGP